MNKKRSALLVLNAILILLLFLAAFGSLKTSTVTQECGLEAVVPCIQHEVTHNKDVLGDHRMIIVTVLSISEIIALWLILRQNHRVK